MSELLKAAVELQGHAWLARFELADESNKYNEMSPIACNQIAGYVKWFIDEVLAEHPADDDEPVTEEWMESTIEVVFYRGHKLTDVLSIYNSPIGYQLYFMGKDNRIPPEPVAKLSTRGDVRRLCRALGITLTEPKQCTS